MIRIDDSTVIIEPYMDGGESYEGHSKYAVIDRYETEGDITAGQTWEGARVTVLAGGRGTAVTRIPVKDMGLFDTATVKMQCPETVRVRILFDDTQVMDVWGSGNISLHEGQGMPGQMSRITFEFINTSDKDANIILYYLGATDRKRKKVPYYSGNWEGFFEEKISFEPMDEDVLDKEQVERFRRKIREGTMDSVYQKAKNTALEILSTVPEQRIGKTVEAGFRQERLMDGVIDLALVGILEEREDMVRMALRYALSAASCTYWCCDDMEESPTVVWHHRSFTEMDTSHIVASVLSLCGRSLTWHGKNLLYQGLLLKGLSRMEADFMSMEYIYYMNQGIAFMSGYIHALYCLLHEYPRIESKILAAEKMFWEMYENVRLADGSMNEGAGYWSYTMGSALRAGIYFAKYRGQTLMEYLGEKLRPASQFGVFLSDNRGMRLAYNDSRAGKWNAFIPSCFYQLSGDKNWAFVYHRSEFESLEDLVLSGDVQIPEVLSVTRKELEEYPDTGLISLTRNGTRLICITGPSGSGHSHYDKGSFLLSGPQEDLLIDRGTLPYSKSGNEFMQSSEAHNMAVPLDGEKPLCQVRGEAYRAPYELSYENGRFCLCSDLTDMWQDQRIIKNTRIIETSREREYLITDSFTFCGKMGVMVNFHMPDKDRAEITVCEGEIEKIVDTRDNMSIDHPVIWRKSIYVKPAEQITVKTRFRW